jgi:hypothetical protein
LDVLPDITAVSDIQFNAYNAIANNLTHEPFFLHVPDYRPANEVTDRGDGPFSNEEDYHVNMAAILLLGKWFGFLKENGVYNNTRIIVVSDHGTINMNVEFPENIVFPGGSHLVSYTALLLAKDFDAHGVLAIDDSFMTNADVPLIALDGIVDSPVNPWTGKALSSGKANGITLTTSELWSVDKHLKYQFDIKPDEWLHVRDNIYDPGNWSKGAN